jgi:Family of unknown function (DUF6529)
VTATTPPVEADRSPRLGLLAIFLIGAAVSVGLGAYGRIHDPTGRRIVTLGFSAMPNMKIWLATTAFVLALFQVISALWIYERLPRAGEPPAWIKPVHRWSGTVAFVLTVPVAYHCLWSIGYGNRLADDSENLRRNLHSFFGCVFYGAFAVKMLALRAKRLPGWTLPVAGGLLFGALTVLWLTSSVWWFTQVDFPAF